MKQLKNEYYILLIIYLSVVLLKLFLLPLIPTPTILGDEVIYLWIAQAPFENQIVVGNQYPPLYPLILSVFPSDSIQTSYLITKALNIFISTLIIFPIYFLSRLFLNKQISLIIGLFSLFIPIGFTYSFLVMSENLFYPLFLISVYLIFKSEKENKKWLYSITGIVIALTTLTRIIGLVLIVSYLLYILYKFILYKEYNKHQNITLTSFSLIAVPYFIIYKVFHYGLTEKGIFGYTALSPLRDTQYSIFSTFQGIISHFDYLILGAGTILGTLSLVELYKIIKNKEKSVFGGFTVFSWVCAFYTIIICGIFLSGEQRTVSRYVAFLIPLFFIVGFKSIGRWNNSKSKVFLSIIALTYFLSFFIVTTSGSETEILKCYFSSIKNIFLIETFIILIFIFILLYPALNIRKKKKIAKYAAIVIIWILLISGVNNEFQDRALMSQKTFNNEVIGKYLQNYNEEIIFDEGIYYEFKNYFWRLRFLNNGKVNIGDINTTKKMFVTSKQLSYPIIVQQNVTHGEKDTVLYLYKK